MTLTSACGGTPKADPATPTSHDAPPGHGHGHQHGHDHDPGQGHGMGYHHHRFDDAAKWAKVFDDPTREEWQHPARVVEIMGISKGMTVADIGAGTGYFLGHLSHAVGPSGKVIGQDIEPDMVKWMEARAKKEGLPNVEGLLGAADDPKLAASSVDRVLIVDVWHHVDDRPAFAKKLATSLKAGGQIYVVDFTMESPHGPPKEARLAPEAIESDFKAAGLETSVVKDAGLPHQYVVRAKR